MNAIGGDTLEMLQAGVAEAERNFAALVVGNDAPNFSAGANLMLLLLEAQEGNWDEVDLMVRVVPARDDWRCGTRRCLWSSRRRGWRSAAAVRSCCTAIASRLRRRRYIGLVEVGVGLIPAGGGNQGDAGARSGAPAGRGRTCCRPCSACSRQSASAKVSTSGPDARADRLSARRGRHLDEPRAAARRRQGACARSRARGYQAAAAPDGHARRRRVGARGARAGRSPRVARRAHQRSRRRHRPQAWRGSSPEARCRTRRP